MDWTSVNSSNVQAVAFDEEGAALYVRFVGGGTYVYDGVTRDVYEAMMGAESKGRYLNAAIKPNFPATRMGG